MPYNYDILLQMPVSYLRNIAKNLGLVGYSTLVKQELVDFLLTNTSLKNLNSYIDEWQKERFQTEMQGAFLEKQLIDPEISKQIDRYNDEMLQQQLEQFQFVSKQPIRRQRKRISPYEMKKIDKSFNNLKL